MNYFRRPQENHTNHFIGLVIRFLKQNCRQNMEHWVVSSWMFCITCMFFGRLHWLILIGNGSWFIHSILKNNRRACLLSYGNVFLLPLILALWLIGVV